MVPEMLTEPSSRCRCANQKDKKCLNFCQAGKDLWCVSCCYSLKGNACERDGLWCTYSFWHLLSEYSPQSLASYLSAHTFMIHTMAWPRKIAYYMPWEVVDEMPHFVDCRLGFFFNSRTFSLLTGLSPQWRKPHGTASKPAIALDPNAWTNSLLTARKWSGEFLLILL